MSVQQRVKSQLMYRAFSVVLLIGLGLGLLVVERTNNLRYETDVRADVEGQLRRVSAELEYRLGSEVQLIRGLVSVISFTPDLTQKDFERAAAPLLGKHTYLRNIAAAPGLVIRYMHPMQGNEEAVGLDYRSVPAQFAAADLARTTGELILAGPLTLVQGGEAFIARIPVFTSAVVDANKSGAGAEREFWGLISAVIDSQQLLQDSGLEDESLGIELALRGKDGDVVPNQIVARKLLERFGHSVCVVGDGELAVAEVQRHAYDLVLMDIRMPKMDGLTATRVIRQLSGPVRKIPIIALTANVSSDDQNQCRRAGCDDFIAKPINVQSLKDTLARYG